jgi:hypothetical protein
MGTVNAPAIDGFLGFLNWVKEQKEAAGSPGAVNYSITPVRFPTYQNFFILPMELRQQYSQEIRDYMDNPDNLKWFNEYDLVNINRFIHYVATAEVPHKEVIDMENQTVEIEINYPNSLVSQEISFVPNTITLYDVESNQLSAAPINIMIDQYCYVEDGKKSTLKILALIALAFLLISLIVLLIFTIFFLK